MLLNLLNISINLCTVHLNTVIMIQIPTYLSKYLSKLNILLQLKFSLNE